MSANLTKRPKFQWTDPSIQHKPCSRRELTQKLQVHREQWRDALFQFISTAVFFYVSIGRVKNGWLKSSAFTVVLSDFNLMVNDDARTRDWAQGKLRNKSELRITASTEWCCGKNIGTIHTLISDDDTLMKIKDDHSGDNYVDENDEVEDFAILRCRISAFVWSLKANTDACAIWSLMVYYGIRGDEHKVSHEMYFVIFHSGPTPTFMMASICFSPQSFLHKMHLSHLYICLVLFCLFIYLSVNWFLLFADAHNRNLLTVNRFML